LSSINLLKIDSILFKTYPIRCQSLLLSEKKLGGIFSKSDFNQLQSFSGSIRASNTNKTIFIHRRNTKKGLIDRGLQYAEEIVSRIQKMNIEIVYLEDFSLDDQIKLVKSAKTLIGFHGAGLANMVWQESNAKIIEISETRITQHFRHIASVCGHEYVFLKASTLLKRKDSELESIFKH